MNASAKKDLPAPDAADLGAAMRRRYHQAPEPDTAEEKPAAVPAADEATTSRAHDVTTSRSREAVKPRGHDVVKPRRREAVPPRSAAPAAADSVALTVRFDPESYDELDDWMTALRRELGWRKLDKSQVVRTLLDLAQTRADVRRALLSALKSL